MATPAYLRYLNQNATRNKPLSPQLANALGFLPELGITAEVFSGGQDGKGEGDRRTGSVRHDHGGAADVFFTRDGRRLDWANPEDRPIFEEIVRRGKANGLTGFGAGPGYMQAGSMHVGFGAPGVWGAGGRSANAPDWLRTAYGEAPAGSVPESGGQETLYGAAGNDDLSGGSMPQNPMPNNPGGLGGLGGFVRSPAFGDWLTAVGTSLMSSGSDAPLANFGTAFANQQGLRQRRDLIEQEQAEKAEAKAKENQTLAYAEQHYPEIAGMMRAGMSGAEAFTLMAQMSRSKAGDEESFFGNPVPMQNADGTVSYGQIGNRGTFKPITLPEGQSFAPPTKTVDTGTEVILLDQAGNVISRTPKENRQEAADTAAGTVEGRTAAERDLSADGGLQAADNTLALIKDIREDPYLERGTGFSSYGNSLKGTGGFGFQRKVDQARSGAFLGVIDQMRGLGALSEAEGKAATAAVNRMDTGLSQEDFLSAVADYERIVLQGRAKAEAIIARRGGASVPAPSAPAPASPAAGNYRWNPATNSMEPM